jgi:hypothetical protein
MAFDIIGDVHGHADRLVALLTSLGYRVRGGAWRHPDRVAVFVGDFIDRGPDQIETLRIVRTMIDAGAARAVMGNHEFNAIAWATPAPDGAGHLRTRAGRKGEQNRRQHAAFLAAVGEDSREHRAWIDWFKTLPLWLDEDGFRVVHACWSEPHVVHLRERLTPAATLTAAALDDGARRGTASYEAFEIVLKGLEIDLPPGARFTDKDGTERHAMRVRWWQPGLSTYRAACLGPPADIPDVPIPGPVAAAAPAKTTFIGHYWFDPSDGMTPLGPNVACVDYSVARGGALAAYRYDGEPTLRADKFVAV